MLKKCSRAFLKSSPAMQATVLTRELPREIVEEVPLKKATKEKKETITLSVKSFYLNRHA